MHIMDPLKRAIKKHMIKVLVGIALIVFLFVQLEKINDWIFTQGPDVIKTFFDNMGYFSIPFFILLYVTANILLTPSYPFVFVSGMVYGLLGGTIISLTAEVCSATANFFLGRKVKKTFFIHKIHSKKINFIEKYIEKHDFGIILMLRYLGFYFDIVSYASGIAKVKYKNFIIATFIGFIPYILIYAYAGTQLMNIRSSSFVYSILIFKLILFGTFILGYFIYLLVKRFRNANKTNYH